MGFSEEIGLFQKPDAVFCDPCVSESMPTGEHKEAPPNIFSSGGNQSLALGG